ncbi:DUF2867 domain-containing protein [Xenorhabdus budapestensis]|uniref:DUF2867 domain-containing protein n=1 Tax=Xenorhabdus budapestensis TaxID=290110 RepID=A0A2D0J543_XENBU|nr:DUF2867 domain-containing protein [Xenorhabdus budapestensis]PHM29673.1 hypothetical protein Xbud_00210 [Xenorhabdus budapestensis]QTL39577.1 DUF2867 domain-containing protein [Xenorhabdus budapestensis]
MYYRDEIGCLFLDKKDKLDYFSQQNAFIKNKVTALTVYNKMTQKTPLWLRLSFTIRDKISSLAGVKKIHGFSGGHLKETLHNGSHIDFFKIVRISDNEMCLLSKDVHLTVLISLNVFSDDNHVNGSTATVTASVITHSFFGKMYMIPVSLTHGIIVKSMLSKVKFP